ncbi:hypothetical protein OJF2_28130 [Aquisphaera giovannonii]|uniref:Uncharacterized protein n=1 Tax=Aquisphaera giovannonii TaxID=406548 RepID=A0A5B9W178_9BACT|nr:hypothetical protein [Aquisphaera giovannonii]QEH34278.1 hypothetical protein OJF2_28130 [Aquisphaera giovannonii]
MKRLVGTVSSADVTARLYDDGTWEVDTPGCPCDRGAAVTFGYLFRAAGERGHDGRGRERQLRLAAEALDGFVVMADPSDSDLRIAARRD